MKFLTIRPLFLVAILILGPVVGGIGGVVVHYLAVLTMPWLTESQRSLIIPGFLLIGASMGVFGVVAELLRGKHEPKGPGSN